MSRKWNVNNVRWLVPQKHPLETKGQCEYFLRLGYTLINNEGYKVSLNEDGEQIITNKNRRNRPYGFTHPFFWQVLDSAYGENNTTKMIKWDSLGFRFELWCLRMARKLF